MYSLVPISFVLFRYNFTFFFSLTDTNPLQLRDQVVYLPYNIESETVVANVTVTGRLDSLVQPFLFHMESVTQRKLSRRKSKRQRRDIDDDLCEGAGTFGPLNYFCVHRLTGEIKVTDDFKFKDGDEFDVKIRVTDSDPWGKTENRASVKLISRDKCKVVRAFYKDAVSSCPRNVSSASGSNSCPGAECLKPLFDWQEALNGSKVLKMECSFDPNNLADVAQKYSSCIGKSRVTLGPKFFLFVLEVYGHLSLDLVTSCDCVAGYTAFCF